VGYGRNRGGQLGVQPLGCVIRNLDHDASGHGLILPAVDVWHSPALTPCLGGIPAHEHGTRPPIGYSGFLEGTAFPIACCAAVECAPR
jgi:hypothetical protein